MIYFIKTYQKHIVALLFVLGFVFALIGINTVHTQLSLWDVFFKMVPTTIFIDYPIKGNVYIALAKVLFLLATIFGLMVVFFVNALNRMFVWLIQKGDYDLVVGYGKQNQALLTKNWGKDKTIIVDVYLDDCSKQAIQKKGFAFKQVRGSVAVDELQLKNLKKCIISIGSDSNNIDVATQLLAKLDNKKNRKIFIHIENRDLTVLFKQSVIVTNNTNDIIPYSVNALFVQDLFNKHSLLGLQGDIIKGSKDYASIVVGESNLAIEIVYYLASIAHLPNQNTHFLYCVGPQSEKFIARIRQKFNGIDHIAQLSLIGISLDYGNLDFYLSDVWQQQNLTNIFIATGDDDRDLDVAINLQDTTYTKQSAENTLKTKVLFAMSKNSTMAQNINDNKALFKNFYSFANWDGVICRENIIANKVDKLAKLIHHIYMNDKDADIEEQWSNLLLDKKDSNRFQAAHLDVKLLALGLKKMPSNDTQENLLEQNIKILKTKIDYDKLSKDVENKIYPPKAFDNLATKLARAEHNRWCASNYLSGWQYDKNGSGSNKAKLHNCLLPVEDFDTDATKSTYCYDLNSVVSIAKYLSYVGCAIVLK